MQKYCNTDVMFNPPYILWPRLTPLACLHALLSDIWHGNLGPYIQDWDIVTTDKRPSNTFEGCDSMDSRMDSITIF